MPRLDYDKLLVFASEKVVTPFYKKRIKELTDTTLKGRILAKKNPYLFRAKNVGTPEEFVRAALDAFLSSQEETMFGNLMEELAIYICGECFGGKKAETGVMESVDLVFTRDGNHYIVSIKSGTNWGNNDQLKRMKSNFKEIRQVLKSSGVTMPIVAVNGCMYGKDNRPFKQAIDPEMSYYKYCGQEFWELISGDTELYARIIEPLGEEANKRDPEFKEVYRSKLIEMAREFDREFMTTEFPIQIDWVKLIRFVSQKRS